MAKKSTSGKSLVIVESPAKAKTINKYLGGDYVVKASMGHVRDLPAREFGIDISNGFEPTYEIAPTRKKVIRELKQLAGGSGDVYLATDLDREGEAIAWHLAQALNLPESRIKRVIFNEITAPAIKEAFSRPHEIDIDRVNAQQARRILDRIVGYELSPLLWKKIAKGLSAGRVQSVAVRLIVEREREIRAFVPEESWKIVGYITGDPAGGAKLHSQWKKYLESGDRTQKDIQKWLSEREAFRVELATIAGEAFKPDTAEAARKVVEALGFKVERVDRKAWEEYKHLKLEQVEIVGSFDPANMPSLRVADLTTKRTTTRPAAPFTTATLQQTASTRLSFAASRTMRVAQSLYEGVDLHGEGPVGLITYMRTDSTNLSGEAIKSVRGYIQNSLGDRYLPEKPNFYGKRQARAQEAHEAVRPTDPHRTPESLKAHLTGEQYRLYDLIWRRFVACQMPPAQWDSTSVSIACDTPLGEARFAGNGRKLVFDGFMRISGVTSEDQILPEMEVGKPVGLLDLEPKQQFTSPPPRYTEASLVKAMETEGIGRPSTYASIIDTIQTRGYVEQEERKFWPTALGELVTDKLIEHFPQLMDVKFTSYMEDELDKIEEAHLDWVHVLHEFYDPFKDRLEQAGEGMEAVRSQPSDHVCPECGQPMLYRWSKTGRFLACSGYPKCKVTFNVDRRGNPIVPKQTEHNCELCGKPMVLRHSKLGHFLGCSGYPECRNTIAANEHGEPLPLVKEEDLKRPCDVCGEGTMVVKRKGRRAFLGCDQYPRCKNTASVPSDVRLESKPLPPPEEAGVACEKCGRSMVIRSGKRGKFIACTGFPKCRNTRPIEKLEELQKSSPAKSNGEAGSEPGSNGAAGKAGAGNSAGKSSKRAAGKNGKVSVEELGEPPAGFAWTRTGRPVVETMPAEDEDLHCPECGEPMLLKRGRFGPFFSCTGFPKCKFVSNLRGDAKKKAEELMPPPDKPKPEPSGIDCEECGKEMLIREGRRGKFLGCSGYPKCTATRELPAGVGA